MLALTIEKTVNYTGSAHLEQTLSESSAGAVKAHIDIVDGRIEALCNAFTRFFEQIGTPDHLCIFRLERRQEAIQTIADSRFDFVIAEGFGFRQLGKLLRVDNRFPGAASGRLAMEIDQRRRKNFREPPLYRRDISQVTGPLDCAKHEPLKHLFGIIAIAQPSEKKPQHPFMTFDQSQPHSFVHGSQRLLWLLFRNGASIAHKLSHRPQMTFTERDMPPTGRTLASASKAEEIGTVSSSH